MQLNMRQLKSSEFQIHTFTSVKVNDNPKVKKM